MDDLFEMRSYYTRRPHFVQTEPRELLFAKRLLL